MAKTHCKQTHIKNYKWRIRHHLCLKRTLHEIYYVSKAEGVSTDELIAQTAALTAIDNLTFLDTTYEIDLLALALIRQYGFTSIFDAYYAATALNQLEDHTIISTDTIFDCIPGIKRIDPQEIKF